MKFNEYFTDLVNESGLKQKELAKGIGLNQSQISRYLEDVLPDVKSVVKICDYFGCSVDYILGISENRTYRKMNGGYRTDVFYKIYERLLKENNTTHFALSKKGLVCETSLRLWKNGMIPSLTALFNIAKELSSSVDFLLGRI